MFRGKLAGTLVIAVLIVVMLGALIAFFSSAPAPVDTIELSDKGPRMVALIALLVVFLGSLLAGPPSIPTLLRSIVVWCSLALLLVAGYSYRSELETVGRRMVATLMPGLAVSDAGGTITVVRDRSRHYRIQARINGAPVTLMFDTGASAVTLTHADAQAAGFDTARLSYTVPVSTANGMAQVAVVRIDNLSIGTMTLTDLRAYVARDGALETSLFGMSALDRLKSWRVEGDRLLLEP